ICRAQDFEVEEASFNSEYSDYSPVPYKDGLVFCSDRKSNVFVTTLDSANNFTSSLFYIERNGDKFKDRPELFRDVASFMNEGPACFSAEGDVMYFTSNLHRTSFSKKQNRLGIYRSELIGSEWSDPVPFEFNSPDNTYDVAHPALTADGKTLYFSSNMDGGYGEADIYMCVLENGQWSEPKNLGSKVNTKGHDLFPSVGPKGRLYYSTNGNDKGKHGLDVYFSFTSETGRWMPAMRLNEPVNSEFDDYGLVVEASGEEGYFSSDRDGNDNIFKFFFEYPKFEDCEESAKPIFCYHLEESEIQQVDTLPFTYYWDFGDGERADGLIADHCWPGFGSYDVSLNVVDTITGLVYAQVSEATLSIEKINRPYITSMDTVKINEDVVMNAYETDMDWYAIEEYYWTVGDDDRLRGEEIIYQFAVPGTYRIQLGVESVPNAFGVQKTCSYKDIVVVDDPDYVPSEGDAPLAMRMIDGLALPNDIADAVPVKGPSIYYIEFEKSEEQIPLSDPYFDKISYEITERYNSDDSLYRYSVGESEEVANLYNVYRELLDSGYTNSIVLEREIEAFEDEVLTRGTHIREEVRMEMNRQINKFADIRFATNAYKIDEESYRNLNRVMSVMMMEPDIQLKVSAFTDDTGTDYFNQNLSTKRAESVRDYLVSKGINEKRITAIGYGSSRPKVANDSEAGRAKNRRVEFEILSDYQIEKHLAEEELKDTDSE
ncbi:MAG: OmpA family protein, partial [Flavobacteriales bacterium]|nr:OmpA family protein [Flavobacteriales bacterium]